MNTEQKKEKGKNNKILRRFVKFSIILIVLSTACIGVFYFSYSYVIDKSDNSYEKDIKSHISKINNLNDDIGKMASSGVFIKSSKKNQSIDEQKYTSEVIVNLTSIIKKLSEEQDIIESITAPKKYIELHSNLVKGINNNCLLYKEILYILQNPSIDTVDVSEKNIDSYRDICINSYAFVSNVKNFNISLPDTSLSFVYNFTSYADVLAKTNKDKMQSAEIMTNYIKSVDVLVNKFISIRKNYIQDLPAIRNSSPKNYDGLILSVDRSIGNIDDILNSLSSAAVPPEAAAANSAFKNALNDYNDYLANFENSVLSEKDQSTAAVPNKNNSLNDIYSTSNNLYTNALQDYDDFNRAYSVLKSSSTN